MSELLQHYYRLLMMKIVRKVIYIQAIWWNDLISKDNQVFIKIVGYWVVHPIAYNFDKHQGGANSFHPK